MMTLFIRLSLFFLLTCSFNSFAKYSEALCILYKQQMQQHKDNTSSQSYRNAARDYKKNCSKAPPIQVEKQESAKSIVIDEPTFHADTSATVEPIEVLTEEVTQTVTVNPLDTQAGEANSAQAESVNSNDTLEQVKDSTPAIIDISEETNNAETVEPLTVQTEPTQAVVKYVPPVVESQQTESASLLIPTVLLLGVLLLAAFIVFRIREKNKAAVEPITPAPELTTPVKAPQSTIKPISVEPVTDTQEVSNCEPAITPNEPVEKPTVNRIDLTQRIFKNEHDFEEPEIRIFDPNAPLPGTKPIKSEPTKEPIESDEAKPSDTPSERTEDTQPTQPQNIHPEVSSSHEVPVATTVVEPIKNEPLVSVEAVTALNAETENMAENDEVAQALTALNNELVAEQQKAVETKASTSADPQAKKANPFANLSLDPTWAPDSNEKPTIEPKKIVPKSPELIAAEERAKQLKTDD
ncbi:MULTISPECIES: hypothetical protein [Pseudoalteromonas]|uniref:hypothetical protein n=1 Tax=Pseudoalteromonas TaxID=53246 RepID=UPI000AD3E7DD|nr:MULTISPECIES: hypothetical protein [Pseudoalteromonas]